MANIGNKIFNLRKEKGVSQEKLAEALGVARFTVSRWETGAVQPTAENMKSLCEFFDVASTYFFDSDEEIATSDEAQELPHAKKEFRFKTLKIVSIVAGMVLLAFLIAACGIAAYVAISPGSGGEWGEDIHIVNYEGIAFLIAGTVAVAVLITLTVILTLKFIKSKKSK